MKKPLLIVTCVCLALLCSLTAAADERKFTTVLSAGEKYNDNIFYSYDDEIDDYITEISGTLRFLNRTERTGLNLSARLHYSDYAEEDDLNGTDQYYNAGVSYDLTPRLNGSLDAAYSRDSQPDRDIDSTGLVLGTDDRDRQKYGGALQYQFSEITTLGGSYRFNREDFADSEVDDFDYQQATLFLNRRLDRYWDNTTGRLYFNYATYDYYSADIDYYSGTVGLLWEITEVWYVLCDVGTRYTESTLDVSGVVVEENNGWGWVGSVQLKYHGEYAAVGMSLSHDIGTASGFSGPVERTSAEVDMSYRFVERLRTGVGCGYYLNKADAGDLMLTATDEMTLRVRPFMRWGFTDHLALEASYAFYYLDDNIVDKSLTRNVYLLKVEFDYDIIE
jgi:hypothetical protein